MKKIIAIAALALAFAVSAAAQPKAIGGRFGYNGLEASYQHYVGSPNFIEVDLGADFFYSWGFKAAALYNFVFAEPAWTSRGNWAWYAGAGLSTGYVYDRGKRYKDDIEGVKVTNYDYDETGMGFMLSVPVQVGLSYTFWFPLQLSVDVRPYFGLHNVTRRNEVAKVSKTGFYEQGLWGFTPTLSVHYAF
ncbi:MAG: hypothetical protein MJY56_05820 [Bacteroidales bacterium]|nr:hypothetical protein [Bacteroidales bacterium]